MQWRVGAMCRALALGSCTGGVVREPSEPNVVNGVEGEVTGWRGDDKAAGWMRPRHAIHLLQHCLWGYRERHLNGVGHRDRQATDGR